MIYYDSVVVEISQNGEPAKTWYEDADSDGFGNPNGMMKAVAQPWGFVSDNTDCDDTNASVYPGATEIAGDAVDQDCDGSDLQLGGAEEIFLLSPFNNETIGYGSSGGKLTFSFSKVTDAAKYILHLNLYDILGSTSIPVPVELVPPGTGVGNPWGSGGATATPGFSEQFMGMVFDLSLDSVTWDVLALYDIQWGVEAYDADGNLIGTGYTGSGAAKYVNAFKLLSSNAIVMTDPSNGENLVKTGSAPVFQWETYQGAVTYLVVLAHVGTLGFDTVITGDNLTLNLFPMNEAAWQTMPTGKWYWTVVGYDASGNQMPVNFTLFDFSVSASGAGDQTGQAG